MLEILIFSKFCNEYKFLEAKLKQQKFLSNKLKISLKQFILIEDKLWSGKRNLINNIYLERLKQSYPESFFYKIYKVGKEFSNYAQRRCREDNANCILAEYVNEIKASMSKCIVISDIDEILDFELLTKIQSISVDKKSRLFPIFVKQKTCWFTSKFIYNNKWPGPIVLFNNPSPQELSLVQTSRHDKGARSLIINGGYHFSYFKSSIISKINNSHGMRYFRIKLFLALLGIDPFLRNDKSYKNDYLDESLFFFNDLSYKWKDLLQLILKRKKIDV